MAYASQTTDDREHPIRFVIEIHGVEQVMVSDAVSPTSLVSSRTQLKCLLQDSLSFGEERLDVKRRAVTGGGLTFQLRDNDSEDLLALFGFRNTSKLTYLVATGYARGGAETTITVEDASSFDSSGTIHIGAEAISYSGKTTTTFTGASRAAYSTVKGDHRAGESGVYNGAQVTQNPQSWRGRRVTVKAGYEDADGTMADLATIGTYRILEPPRAVSDGNTYEVSCGPLSDMFREARCYYGVRDATIQDNSSGIGSETFDANEFGDALPFTSGGESNWHALVLSDADTYRLSEVEGVLGTTIRVRPFDSLKPNGAFLAGQIDPTVNHFATAIRHVALLDGNPVDITLALLTSIEGDATNGTHDSLPGSTSDLIGEHQWRFGAGISASDINVTDPDSGSSVGSIEHLRGGAGTWRYLLSEVVNGGDLLHEFCMATGSFWYVDSAGLLSFERLRDLAPPSLTSQTTALNDTTVITPAPLLRYSEENLAHTVRMKLNYEPIPDKHMVSIAVTDFELRERYPETANEIEIESRFLRVATAGFALAPLSQRIGGVSTTTVEQMAASMRRAQNIGARGEAFVDVECAWACSQIAVGQFVDLDLSRTPDTKGARLSSGRGMVTAKRLNPGRMTVNFTVRVMDAAVMIAATGVIASVSTTTNTNDTWTLDTSDDIVDPDLTSPADAFAATWTIQAYDRDAAAGSEIKGSFTISSVNPGSDQIILTADPGFVPAAGDYFWVTNAGGPTVATSGYEDDDFAFMTDRDGDGTGSVFS